MHPADMHAKIQQRLRSMGIVHYTPYTNEINTKGSGISARLFIIAVVVMLLLATRS